MAQAKRRRKSTPTQKHLAIPTIIGEESCMHGCDASTEFRRAWAVVSRCFAAGCRALGCKTSNFVGALICVKRCIARRYPWFSPPRVYPRPSTVSVQKSRRQTPAQPRCSIERNNPFATFCAVAQSLSYIPPRPIRLHGREHLNVPPAGSRRGAKAMKQKITDNMNYPIHFLSLERSRLTVERLGRFANCFPHCSTARSCWSPIPIPDERCDRGASTDIS